MDDTDGHALRIDLLIECVEKHKKMQHTKASMRNAIAPASQNNCDSSCKTLSHQLQRIVSAGHIFLWSKVSRNSHQGLGPDLKSLVHVSVDCGQMIKNYKEVEGEKAGQQGSKQRYFVVVFSCRFCGCATRKQRSGSSVAAHWKRLSYVEKCSLLEK